MGVCWWVRDGRRERCWRVLFRQHRASIELMSSKYHLESNSQITHDRCRCYGVMPTENKNPIPEAKKSVKTRDQNKQNTHQCHHNQF